MEDRLRHVETQLAVIVERIDHHTDQDAQNFRELKAAIEKLAKKLDSVAETVSTAHAARNAERRLVLLIAGLVSTVVSIVTGLLSLR